MPTTKDDIRGWIKEGKKKKATHVIVMCDTFDYGDYPLYVLPGESALTKAKDATVGNMAKVMECYSLSLDIESQLNEHRASHWD